MTSKTDRKKSENWSFQTSANSKDYPTKFQSNSPEKEKKKSKVTNDQSKFLTKSVCISTENNEKNMKNLDMETKSDIQKLHVKKNDVIAVKADVDNIMSDKAGGMVCLHCNDAVVTDYGLQQSQDNTTIPETQDISTQDTSKISSKDLFSDRETELARDRIRETGAEIHIQTNIQPELESDSPKYNRIMSYQDIEFSKSEMKKGRNQYKTKTSMAKKVMDNSSQLSCEFVESGKNGPYNSDLETEAPLENPTESFTEPEEFNKDEDVSFYDNEISGQVNEELSTAKSSEIKTSTSDFPEVTKPAEILWLNMLRGDTSGSNQEQTSGSENVPFMAEEVKAKDIESRKDTEKPFIAVKVNLVENNTNRNKNNFCTNGQLDQENAKIRYPKEEFSTPMPAFTQPEIDRKSGKTDIKRAGAPFMSPPLRKKGTDMEVSSILPDVEVPGETWYNVSPTATSISSDVFLVKAKELDRRMKRRVQFSQENLADSSSVFKTPNEDVGAKMNNHNHENSAFGATEGHNPINKGAANSISVIKTATQYKQSRIDFGFNEKNKRDEQRSELKSLYKHLNVAEDPIQGKDTVSDAIESVVRKSRKTAEANIEDEKAVLILNRPQKFKEPAGEPVKTIKPVGFACEEGMFLDNTVPDLGKVTKKVAIQKQAAASTWLPTMRELIECGVLMPGKNALTVHFQGRFYGASLTNQGKIRTDDGLTFHTAAKWLSALETGTNIKKKQAYQRICYQGRPLLHYCNTTPKPKQKHGQANIHRHVGKSLTMSTRIQAASALSVSTTNREVQVDTNLLHTTDPVRMSDDERWLNERLSTSVVRLLKQTDFLPNADLPRDFWTGDFSKVKLPVSMWNAVDCW